MLVDYEWKCENAQIQQIPLLSNAAPCSSNFFPKILHSLCVSCPLCPLLHHTNALSFRLVWLWLRVMSGVSPEPCNLFRARTDILCDCDNFFHSRTSPSVFSSNGKARALCRLFLLASITFHMQKIRSTTLSHIPTPFVSTKQTNGENYKKNIENKRLYDTRMQNVVCWTIAKYLDNCDPWLCSVCVVGMFRFGQTARSCHPRPIRCHLRCVALYGGHWGSRLLLRLDTSRNEWIHGNIFATAGKQRNRHHSVATDETIKPWPRPRTLSAFSCPLVTAAST